MKVDFYGVVGGVILFVILNVYVFDFIIYEVLYIFVVGFGDEVEFFWIVFIEVEIEG